MSAHRADSTMVPVMTTGTRSALLSERRTKPSGPVAFRGGVAACHVRAPGGLGRWFACGAHEVRAKSGLVLVRVRDHSTVPGARVQRGEVPRKEAAAGDRQQHKIAILTQGKAAWWQAIWHFVHDVRPRDLTVERVLEPVEQGAFREAPDADGGADA